MSLALYFDPTKIPRSINREEWKRVWRWKRITQKKLVEELNLELEFLMTYGTTLRDDIKQHRLDRIINPPLLLGPYMDRK